MLFGRVRGTAICTIKYPGTEGVKLLVVQPLNKKLEPVGILQVAADVVHAGPGDLCVMVRSREAALAMSDPDNEFWGWGITPNQSGDGWGFLMQLIN